MAYDLTEADAFRTHLLESPSEGKETEYKSSLSFDGKSDFSLRILKHIQGMANSGGGSIIIGFTEEGNRPYEPDPKHTNEIASTYDTTKLSDAANASVFGDQPIELSVYHTELKSTGLIYPIITVQPFKRQPVVCSRNTPKALRQGAVYVRTPSAKTTELSRLDDWEDLINRCVAVRQGEFLDRLGNLLGAMTGRAPPQEDAFDKLDDWTKKMRERAFGRE